MNTSIHCLVFKVEVEVGRSQLVHPLLVLNDRFVPEAALHFQSSNFRFVPKGDTGELFTRGNLRPETDTQNLFLNFCFRHEADLQKILDSD